MVLLMIKSNEDSKISTIKLSVGTKKRLAILASKDETYESIIKKLLDLHASRLIK